MVPTAASPQRSLIAALPDIVRRVAWLSLVPLALVALHAARSASLAVDFDWFAEGTDDCNQRVVQPLALCTDLTLALDLLSFAFLFVVAVLLLAVLHRRPAATSAGAPLALAGLVLLAATAPLVLFLGPGDTAAAAETSLLCWGGALVGLLFLAIWLRPEQDDDGEGYAFLAQVWASFPPLRVHVALVGAFFLLFLVLPESSGQALDSLRTWRLDTYGGAATAALGLSSSVLVALCLREVIAHIEADRVRFITRPRHAFPGVSWLVVGVLVSVVGTQWARVGSQGITAVGLVIIATALVDLVPRVVTAWPDADRPQRRSQMSAAARRELKETRTAMNSFLRPGHSVRQDMASARMSSLGEALVAAPLVILGAALSLVAYEDFLLGTHPIGVGPTLALAGVALAAAAFVSRTERLRPPRPIARVSDELARLGDRLHALHPRMPGPSTYIPPLLVLVPGLAFLADENEVNLVVILLAAALPTVAYAVALSYHPQLVTQRWATALAVWGFVATAVAIHLDPATSGALYGLTTFVNVVVAFLAVVTGQLVLRSIRTRPPRGLIWFGLRSLPILSIGLLAWIVAGLVPTDGLHDVTVHPREPVAAATELRTPTLEDAFDAWVDAQPEMDAEESRAIVPLVLVASHGGGIRAAYWTTLVLDCVVARARLPQAGAEPCTGDSRSDEEIVAAARRIFIASGVSGGSVGIAAYAQNLLRNDDLSDRDWMATAFGRDLASATVGWGLFHDLPNHFLGLASATEPCDGGGVFPCTRQDRAGVLERAFDEPAGDDPPLVRGTWDERGSPDLAVRSRAETVPLLLFNTTMAGGQFGAVTSAAKLGQTRVNLEATGGVRPDGETDAYPLSGYLETIDLLCNDQDLSISTAAMLSARFPLVSPSGRVQGHCPELETTSGEPVTFDGQCDQPQDECAMTLVDGGYLDNSGLLTLSSLLPEVRRLVDRHNADERADIALVVLDIDSAYQAAIEQRTNPEASSETFIPLTTLMVRGAVERFARSRVLRSLPRSCLKTYAPAAHPGLQAPLGWSLSKATRNEMDEAMQRNGFGKAARREANLRVVQAWLGGSTDRDAEQAKLRACVAPRS